MHPTIDEQLEGIARLVERAAERHPDDPSAKSLRTAAGTLRRIAGSWAEILPYLTRDNREMQRLLERFDSDLPKEVRARLGALVKEEVDPLSARAVEGRNRALRAVLADWVRRLPPSAEIPRAAIIACFRDRIARDPSAGRKRSQATHQETHS